MMLTQTCRKLRIVEKIVEYNEREHASQKRKREEEEFENFDVDALNAIVDVCSMPMEYE